MTPRIKDSKRFPKTGGSGYALFNYDSATGKFVADPATADCGHACHVAVKGKDYIFHPYRLGDLLYLPETLYCIGLAIVMLAGPGPWSADAVIATNLQRSL